MYLQTKNKYNIIYIVTFQLTLLLNYGNTQNVLNICNCDNNNIFYKHQNIKDLSLSPDATVTIHQYFI